MRMCKLFGEWLTGSVNVLQELFVFVARRGRQL